MKLNVLAAAALALGLTSTAFAQANTWQIDPAHSAANFTIRHMGVSNVHGAITKVDGKVEWDEKDITKSSVTADLDATSINTNNDQRDTHLKSPDFFNVAQFPKLHFQSTAVRKASDGKVDVVGNLTLGGQTKLVTLHMDGPSAPVKGMQGGLVSGISATTTISRKEFNFGQKFGAPVLGDDVQIELDLEIDRK